MESLVVPVIQDKCIISPLNKDKDGYPRMKVQGRPTPCGRIIWKILFGDPPSDKLVCHTCDNPSCVNPYHLYLGTFEDNMKDKRDRHRVAGENNPRVKVSDKDTETIKRLYAETGKTQSEIGKLFGITQTTVSHIVAGRRKQTKRN